MLMNYSSLNGLVEKCNDAISSLQLVIDKANSENIVQEDIKKYLKDVKINLNKANKYVHTIYVEDDNCVQLNLFST